MSLRRNWIDKMVGYINPRAGLQRYQARLVIDSIEQRKYEGASYGRRTKGWVTTSSSANVETSSGLTKLRNRARDLVRNDTYAERGVRIIQANLIGTGIIAQPKRKKASEKQLENAKGLWEDWADTLACDFDDLFDFSGIQGLCTRATAEGGEVLIRKRIRLSDKNLPVPLQLQVLEPDFIDSLKTEDIPTGTIVQGIEFDKQGKRVAYWLFDRHPGDLFSTATSQRVPASDIIHFHRPDRAGQVRGVTWLAPAILRLRDLDEYQDAQLIRQKIASCFTAFIHDTEGGFEATSSSKFEVDKFEPGIIETLPPGKDITFGVPPGTEGYAEYVSTILRGLSVGLGVPYEALTGDFSQVNFSSGRMGWLEFQRNIEQWRWHLVIPRVCNKVWLWFVEAAILSGKDIDGVFAAWTPPRREMIDPTSEVRSTTDAIRSGQMTLSDAIRERGYDPETQLRQMQEDLKLVDQLGLVLDCDPRKVTKVGMMQQQTSENPSGENS